ncbi:MAG: DUF2975 domain-containing protein [Planctomycetaceae bacterium]
MKSALIVGLQVTVMLFGLLVLVFLICEPQVEGRNAHATQFEIYFHDSFLAYVYLASVPFFVGLYHVEQLLSQIRLRSVSSRAGIETVRKIKWCAGMILGAAVVSLLFMLEGDPEDRPPGLALRLMVILPSITVALLAARYERRLRNGLAKPPEHGVRS